MNRKIIAFLCLGILCAHAQQEQSLTLDQVAAETTAQHEHALKVTWFWIGVGATTSVLFILAGCAVIFHEVRKKSKEHELRRIASLDS